MRIGQKKKMIAAVLSVMAGPVAFVTTATAQSVVPESDYFRKGIMHVVNSSHQDIAWVNSIEACKKGRADQIMIPVLERLKENPDFCYSVESAMYLDEFLEFYPERYDEVLKYSREGRLEWGATYTQPYEGMYDGEALVRQLYLGRKYLKKKLPGADFKAGWNEDVPGLSLQWPQIMKKSGAPYFNFSRFTTGYYKWFSPDGSYILAASTGQYSGYSAQIVVPETEEKRIDALVGIVNYWDDYQKERKISPACLALVSQDFSLPIDYDKLFSMWDSLKKGNKAYKSLPDIKYSTSTMFFDHLASNSKAKFDIVDGERPNMWLYIHGPTHHKSVDAARKAGRELVAAEKYSTVYSWLTENWNTYPSEKLNEAWKNAIYADHGWGGYDGANTDRTFRNKFEAARDTAESIISDAIEGISSLIGYDKEKLYAVTVYNALSWANTAPASFSLDVEGVQNTHLKLVDEAGNDVPFQFISDHEYNGNRDEVLTFHFVAENVPALGYKTYYVVNNDNFMMPEVHYEADRYENEFYRLRLGDGGIESLYDKELGRDVFNTARFKGAELFTMKSVGTGAGEFSDIQQPTMEGFDKLSNYTTNWNCVESGPVRSVFQTSAQMKDVQAVLRIVVYNGIKKIDVEVDLNGYIGENWREYRMAFPLKENQKDIAYEVPMGVLRVGVDEMGGQAGHKGLQPAYDVDCSGVHPREVQDWFSAWDDEGGLTIGSDVAVFDWIDMTAEEASPYILQPVLLSSRKSCHGWGNYYLQAGNHSFRFSLSSHSGDWKNGYKDGVSHNRPLHVVVTPQNMMGDGQLPVTMGMMIVDAGEDVIVSAVKKCDDDDNIVIRYYDLSGSDQNVKISLAKPFSGVEHTDMIEENGVGIKAGQNDFQFNLGKYAIETFKVITSGQ